MEDKLEEIKKRFGIDDKKLKELEREQEKISKLLSIKDSIDFENAESFAGVENVFLGNKIISAICVVKDREIVEQKYAVDKTNFPYLPGFRAYRELPCMIKTFNLLEEKPDVIFIRGSGIGHARGLGIASHLSLSLNIPVIGITDEIEGEIKDNNVIFNGKKVASILKTKKEARALYVSPGNMISLKTAVELTKKMTIEPHKYPLPLSEARKYAKNLLKEIN